MSRYATKRERTLQYRITPSDPKVAESNRQKLLDVFDKLETGDYDAFWTIFDQDVVFHEAECLPYGGVHKGLEATKKAYALLSSKFSVMNSVFEQVLAAGDLVHLYVTATFKVKANGNTGTLPIVEVFRFRNGKVIEWRALYFDSAMVAKALGGSV